MKTETEIQDGLKVLKWKDIAGILLLEFSIFFLMLVVFFWSLGPIPNHFNL